ncbi:MAG: hypothetical protein V2I25_07010 [Woeseiaceae bacterium]|nr:hypothetical protein [Woeseiaceae bacterium]
MSTRAHSVFGSGFMLATLLMATFAAFAQDVDDDLDAIEPGVDTSAVDYGEAAEGDAAAEPEPALIADDVRRRATTSGVMDEMDLGRTEITGNQELPKVLYIVPWQKSDPGDLMGKPVNTLLDEVLAPLNRDEFIRQVDYYRDLHGEPEG